MGFRDLFSGKSKKEILKDQVSVILAKKMIDELKSFKEWDETFTNLKKKLGLDDKYDISNEFLVLYIFTWDFCLHQKFDSQCRQTVYLLIQT